MHDQTRLALLFLASVQAVDLQACRPYAGFVRVCLVLFSFHQLDVVAPTGKLRTGGRCTPCGKLHEAGRQVASAPLVVSERRFELRNIQSRLMADSTAVPRRFCAPVRPLVVPVTLALASNAIAVVCETTCAHDCI